MISDLRLSRAVFDAGEHRLPVCRPKLTRQFGVTFLLLSIFLQLSIDRTVSAPNPQFTPTGKQNRYPKELEKVLLSGDKLYLFSLDPEFMPPEVRQKVGPESQFFHLYHILGSTEIRDMAERRNLVNALCRGVAEGRQSVLSCFNPRHGIRVIQGSQTLDLVICFESWEIQVHGIDNGMLTVTPSPEPVFTAALKKAGIQVAVGPNCQ